jgi:hypothetical protein
MPDTTTPIDDVKKAINVIFSFNGLKSIVSIVGASWAIITPILIASYCNRFSIPFFEAIDYLGKYINYLVIAISIEVALALAFLLIPSTISYYIPRKVLKRFLLPKSKGIENRSWKIFYYNLSLAARFYWPGMLIILLFHYLSIWHVLSTQYTSISILDLMLIALGAIINIFILTPAIKGACYTIKFIIKSLRKNPRKYSRLRQLLKALQTTSLIMFVAYFLILVSFSTQDDTIYIIFVIIFLPFLILLYFHILVAISSENLIWLLSSAVSMGLLFIFVWPGPSAHMSGILRFLKVGGGIWVRVHFIHEEKEDNASLASMKGLDGVIQHNTVSVFPLILLTKERVYIQIEDANGCSEIQKSLNLELIDCKGTIGIPASTIVALNTYSYSRFVPGKP